MPACNTKLLSPRDCELNRTLHSCYESRNQNKNNKITWIKIHYNIILYLSSEWKNLLQYVVLGG